MQTPAYSPGPFELITLRPGMRGLVVAVPGAAVTPDAAVRLDNWRIDIAGRLRARPGAGFLFQAPAVGRVHTLARLYQPTTGTYIAFVGVGTVLFRGPTPATLAAVSTVLSGNPLICLPYRPALSGDPWMIVADTLVLGQVPPTGEAMLLGLPAPSVGVTSRIVDVLRTTICAFDGTTGASAWTGTAGHDDSEVPVPSGTPVIRTVAGLAGSDAVEFVSNPGDAALGYSNVFGCPVTVDLTQLQGGFRPSEPDDLINIWLRVSRPGVVEEVRVYFVCASGFSATVIPGQSGSLNTDAFVHTFRPSDITGFLEGEQSGQEASEITQQVQVIDEYLRLPQQRNPEDPDDRSGRVPDDPSGAVTQVTVRIPGTLAPGRNVWTQFGIIGRPLRRSDFERIGTTEGRGWDTITGIVVVVKTTNNQQVSVACDDWYLHGGYRLDSTEIGARGYDYRYTHYHLDTGDESNPSAEQAESATLYPARQRIAIQPVGPYTGAGSARVRQRFYRRGGTLTNDWYYLGRNTSNGGEFVDTLSDLEIAAAPGLEIDNYQPVPTVDASGTTVLASVLPAVWGPLDGALYGCGDRYRPGHLYRSKTGKPGSWPPDLVVEVCSPSEELLNGFVYGGQGFVFSRRRLFVISPNLASGGAPTAQDTPCQKGLAGRWAMGVGPDGVVFVSDDGVYETAGGSARDITEDLRPLWLGQTGEGAVAIDLSAEAALRIFLGKGLIYFQYQGLDGARYQFVGTRVPGGRVVWTRDVYHEAMASVYVDPENPELAPYLGSNTTGQVFQLSGVIDGTATPVVSTLHTPEWVFQRPREEKQVGDLIVETAYVPSGALQITPVYDSVTTGVPLAAGGGAAVAAHRSLLTPENGAEQRFQSMRLQAVLTTPITNTQPGEIWQIQATAQGLPEETGRRLGQWEPLGKTGGYLTGVAITADTSVHTLGSGTGSKSVSVEYTRAGVTTTLGPYTLTAAGRRVIYLSWAGVVADQVRLVANDNAPWLLYALAWEASAEPPGQATWDSGEEILGDVYYTGLDLVVRGGGVAALYVDNVLVATRDFRTSAVVNGVPNDTDKTYLHLSFGPGYGHIFRCVITAGSVPVQVYAHKWIVAPMPGEQMNWNRGYELGGTLTDKLVKGVLFDCDTGGQTKTVEVQADGVTQQTLTVVANGRRALHFSFAQFRGRVLRLLPTDSVLSRLWDVQWIFDEEPLSLLRWETQLLTHRQPGWHSVYDVTIGYRASDAVTLTVQGFGREGEQLFEDTYLLTAAAERQRVIVPFQRRLAVYWKYIFTSATAFSLYREDSNVNVLAWEGDTQAFPAQFGNDDLDHGRAMGSASGTAATPNNGSLTEG